MIKRLDNGKYDYLCEVCKHRDKKLHNKAAAEAAERKHLEKSPSCK